MMYQRLRASALTLSTLCVLKMYLYGLWIDA